MAAPIDLRNDFDSVSLRRLRDRGPGTRPRAVAAGVGRYDSNGCVADRRRRSADHSRLGAALQARGPDGLVDGKSPGAPSKLNADHRRALAEVVEAGPVPAVDGVVRWRRKDLARWLFAISLDETTVGRELGARLRQDLGAARHYAHELAVEAHLKRLNSCIVCLVIECLERQEVGLWTARVSNAASGRKGDPRSSLVWRARERRRFR